MGVALYTHRACLDHVPGPGHPESPARLTAVLQALDDDRFATLERIEAPRATRAQLLRAHHAGHLAGVLDAPDVDGRRLDADTVMSTGSKEAALRAAGAVCAAVDRVMQGDTRRAFCAVRPPGHHATAQAVMGFCLFNNIAVGAMHALAEHGLARIAIVDFDVHHGNGTQSVFERNASLFYASTHQWPFYPGTGAAEEQGVGNIVNVPLPSGTDGPGYRRAFERHVLPALEAFAPELVLISAGFDAH
ncbi:MAG: histone deacetylase family protein, partial [Dokdonella sp.]|nr:histone deacetylase family protein [Dokdonella sp.]